MNNYVYIYPYVKIVKYEVNTYQVIFLYSDEQRNVKRSSGERSFKINEISAEIIQQFNGKKTYPEVVEFFAKRYNEEKTNVEGIIQTFIVDLKKCGFEIREQITPLLHEITTSTHSNIYPLVASIELTENCNLRCRHCYGEFSSHKHKEIHFQQLRPMFQSLHEIGVLTVELTGGDPSVYQYTAEAIDIAFDERIESVMLLTNGVKIEKKLIDAIIKHKDKMFVQIDLHSLDETYYNWFTCSKNALQKVKNNIVALTERGVQVRVCSMITPKNYHEVFNIAKWSYEHGAILYAPSLVIELGRAINDKDKAGLIFTNIKQLEEFNFQYDAVEKKYPNFIRGKLTTEQLQRKNCGALTSNCSIKANGDIKLCTMDTGQYFSISMGNVFENSIRTIYDKNKEFLFEILNLPLPLKNCTECIDCLFHPFCDSCLLRGFLKAQDMGDKCKWYQNHVPNKVKERFPIHKSTVQMEQEAK